MNKDFFSNGCQEKSSGLQKPSKLHLNKPQEFWNNVLWIDNSKVEMLESHLVKAKYDLGLFCRDKTLACCSHWVHRVLLYIPKYSKIKYEVICLTAKASLKLGHATEKWSQAQQQICNRTKPNFLALCSDMENLRADDIVWTFCVSWLHIYSKLPSKGRQSFLKWHCVTFLSNIKLSKLAHYAKQCFYVWSSHKK